MTGGCFLGKEIIFYLAVPSSSYSSFLERHGVPFSIIMGIYACMRFYYLVSAETFVTLVNLKKNKMNKKQKDMLNSAVITMARRSVIC